jgi:molecular chaperone GrpE
MSDSKGPKVDLPDELAEALEEQAADEQTQPEFEEAVEGGAAAAAEQTEPEEAPEPARVQELEKELEQTRDKHLRLAAEFENFKRRTLRERHDLLNFANENLIKELLVTVDNLERALGHAQQSEEGAEAKALLEGVDLTYRLLLQTLERFGVTPVKAEGEVFDPQVHEAVRQVPTAEHEPGRVVDVMQKGYLLKERLLRPALVAVSGRPAEEPQES